MKLILIIIGLILSCNISDRPSADEKVRDIVQGLLVIIQRGDEKIIPNGNTILKKGDVLVLLKRDVAVV